MQISVTTIAKELQLDLTNTTIELYEGCRVYAVHYTA